MRESLKTLMGQLGVIGLATEALSNRLHGAVDLAEGGVYHLRVAMDKVDLARTEIADAIGKLEAARDSVRLHEERNDG